MNAQSNEAGGTADAAHQKLTYAATLVAPFGKINRSRYPVWEVEARRLLREYWRTGNSKHLYAFHTHFSAMRAHMLGGRTP
jgi:hypothetical protein